MGPLCMICIENDSVIAINNDTKFYANRPENVSFLNDFAGFHQIKLRKQLF